MNKERNLDMVSDTTDTLNTVLGPDYTYFEKYMQENERTSGTRNVSEMIDSITKNPVMKRMFHQGAHVLKDIRKLYGEQMDDTIYLNMYAPNDEQNIGLMQLRRNLVSSLKKADQKSLLELLAGMKKIKDIRTWKSLPTGSGGTRLSASAVTSAT